MLKRTCCGQSCDTEINSINENLYFIFVVHLSSFSFRKHKGLNSCHRLLIFLRL